MIIAMFGPSASGKTTLARAVATALTCPVRHCGELVKERSRLLGTTPFALPLEEHQVIDQDTVRWANGQENTAVVEGTYLNHVLKGPRVVFLEIACLPSVREERLAKRARNASADIATVDRLVDELRSRLYLSSPAKSTIVIETSRSTPETMIRDTLHALSMFDNPNSV